MKLTTLSIVFIFFSLTACGSSGPCPSGATQQVEKKDGEARVVACYDDNGLKHGPFSEYFSNNEKKEEGEFRNGKQEGKWNEWHENGQKSGEGEYQNGEREGKYLND